jgi:TATA-box binding protein (TBP) (component of TFIID and TFIIIB)
MFITQMNRKKKCPPTPQDLYFPNTVAILKLHTILDLEVVARIFLSKYERGVFPVVVCKCNNTKATVSIFQSGDIVVTGAKAIDDPHRSISGIDMAIITAQLTVLRLMECLHIEISIYELRIPNIVASVAYGYDVDIPAICTTYTTSPGLRFPGVKIKDEDLIVTFILFRNGNINVTGIKGNATSLTIQGQVEKLDDIKKKLAEFKRYRV